MNLLKKIIGKTSAVRKQMKEKRALQALPQNSGYCNICGKETTFIIYGERLRRDYKCISCQTVPRNRALVNALDKFAPDWKTLQLHESSPSGEMSKFLKSSCSGYSSSHYYPDVPRGEYKGEHRSEDLQALTFSNESFDLIVTSDVFEHVFEPAKAFAEVARVLKPGGMHIFTMPWYPHLKTFRKRAKMNADGSIEYFETPDYHGNPITGKGALVTYDWGLDFTDFIHQHSGMTTTIYLEIDRKKGLDGQFLEVFISRKPYAAK